MWASHERVHAATVSRRVRARCNRSSARRYGPISAPGFVWGLPAEPAVEALGEWRHEDPRQNGHADDVHHQDGDGEGQTGQSQPAQPAEQQRGWVKRQ